MAGTASTVRAFLLVEAPGGWGVDAVAGARMPDEVRAHFGARVYETTIPRNVRLSEAPSHGKPVLLYDIRSKGATSYLALAAEFLKRREAGTRGVPRRPPQLNRQPIGASDVHASS